MKTSIFLIAAVTAQYAAAQYYDAEPRRLRAIRGLQDAAASAPASAKAEKATAEKVPKSSSAKSGKSDSAKAEKVADAKAAKHSKAAKLFKSKTAKAAGDGKSGKSGEGSGKSGKSGNMSMQSSKMEGKTGKESSGSSKAEKGAITAPFNSKTAKSKSFKSEKGVTTADFLEYAEEALEEANDLVCAGEGDSYNQTEVCANVAQLVASGVIYEGLPHWYQLNYRAMTMAYPLMGTGSSYFIDVFRIHRALGLGNALRLQGYDEDNVNTAYWNHYNLLEMEDDNAQLQGDGIATYCAYIAREYQTLKDFALINYNETFASAEATFPATDSIEDSGMYKLCNFPDPNVSYVVRTDWEHHRSEVIGSLMKVANTEPIVSYTVWHWESLFALFYGDQNQFIPQLFDSFNALLPFAEVATAVEKSGAKDKNEQ